MRKSKIVVGGKYGQWEVLEILGYRPVGKSRKTFVRARCSCGTEKELVAGNILNNRSRRCAKCLSPEERLFRQRKRKPDGEVNRFQAYKAYWHAANRKKRYFDLTYEQFLDLAKQNCHYCGSPPSNVYDLKYSAGEKKGQSRCGKPFVYNGLDRKDSGLGYTVGNCVPCCIKCNHAKSDLTLEEFTNWIRAVIEKGTIQWQSPIYTL